MGGWEVARVVGHGQQLFVRCTRGAISRSWRWRLAMACCEGIMEGAKVLSSWPGPSSKTLQSRSARAFQLWVGCRLLLQLWRQSEHAVGDNNGKVAGHVRRTMEKVRTHRLAAVDLQTPYRYRWVHVLLRGCFYSIRITHQGGTEAEMFCRHPIKGKPAVAHARQNTDQPHRPRWLLMGASPSEILRQAWHAQTPRDMSQLGLGINWPAL